MIPYMVFESFRVGPLTIQVWGLFVGFGILAAALLAAARARRRGIDPGHVLNAAFWVIIGGFLGARVLFLVEEPEALSFWYSLRFQDGGLSAFGGILGGALASVWVVRRHRWSFRALADLVGPPALLGEGIGRLGCFAIHDHLGRITVFPLAINVFGVPRHDVGVYHAIAGFLGWIVLSRLERARAWPPGVVGVLSLLWYALSRFLLDFLRAADLPVVDARYAGFTLAQILGGVTILWGVWFLWYHWRQSLSTCP